MQTPDKLLKEQRSKANLTQEGLSEKSGIPVRLISSWERGLSHPNYNNLKKLKKAFSCTYEDLFDGTIEDLEKEMSKTEEPLTEYQIDIMKHTIKGNGRNWFGTGYGCRDSDEFEKLVESGHATKEAAADWMGDDVIYRLTEKGIKSCKC